MILPIILTVGIVYSLVVTVIFLTLGETRWRPITSGVFGLIFAVLLWLVLNM